VELLLKVGIILIFQSLLPKKRRRKVEEEKRKRLIKHWNEI